MWFYVFIVVFFFFFQAEDGIRDRDVTGVQTCALPISAELRPFAGGSSACRGSAAPRTRGTTRRSPRPGGRMPARRQPLRARRGAAGPRRRRRAAGALRAGGARLRPSPDPATRGEGAGGRPATRRAATPAEPPAASRSSS